MGLRKVRIGIVGVGNCASSIVQGLTYYRDAQSNELAPGLMHVELGGYHISDIEVSAAFDVNVTKIGKDVSEAIFARPNNTQCFSSVAPTGVTVCRGMTLDGLGKYLSDVVEESKEDPADVTEILRHSRTDILVSYLPVGAQKAMEWYAECALEAGCTFVNCIPVFIASKSDWQRRFEERGLPIVGDDIHVGPSDHVPWLTDRKWTYIRLKGTTFVGVSLNVELKLKVWDSPNSAGIVIDAVLCAKLAMDRKIGGALIGPSSYFMKSPPEQFTDNEVRERTIRFINGDDD